MKERKKYLIQGDKHLHSLITVWFSAETIVYTQYTFLRKDFFKGLWLIQPIDWLKITVFLILDFIKTF